MNLRQRIFACLLALLIAPCAAQAQADPARLDASVYKTCFSSGSAKAEDVIAACSAIVENNPQAAEAYYNRGVVRMGLNQLDGALADFSRAIELKPRDPDAWNNLGLVNDRQAGRGLIRLLPGHRDRRCLREGIQQPRARLYQARAHCRG